MSDEGRVVLTALVEQVCAGDLAQSLAQVDEPVQAANGEGQQGQVIGYMRADLFESQVVTAGENDGRFAAFG